MRSTVFPTVRERAQAVKCALGEVKADLVIRDVSLVNVVTEEVEEGVDVAVKGRLVAYVGDCSKLIGQGTRVINARGLYAVPGLVDAHVHVESSMLVPHRFAKYALMYGVTTIFADPHEIGNVLGKDGIREFIRDCVKLPLKVFVTVPSCIPACRLGLETCPTYLSWRDVAELLDEVNVMALGEVMDVLSVHDASIDILLEISETYNRMLRVCGHAPQLTGPELQAYLCAGPDSDHEVTRPEEAIEKIRRGMYLMIRLGTFSHDLPRILPSLDKKYLNYVMLVSDDINVLDLERRGYLDRAIREAIRCGLDPVVAVKLCTLNPARYYGLDWLIGSINPGKLADIVLVENLEDFKIRKVIVEGRLVRDETGLLIDIPRHEYPRQFYMSVKLPPELSPDKFELHVRDESGKVRANVIRFVPGTVVTKLEQQTLEVHDGKLVLPRDVYYIAVVERHGKTGTMSIGLCTGITVGDCALAVSICHDSHNIVVVGRDGQSMYTAVTRLQEIGGGLTLARGREILAQVELPVAGLMSDQDGAEVADKLQQLLDKWREHGGAGALTELAPLMFTSLTVIPEVRLTDRGLVDVRKGKYIPVIEKL